MTRRSAFTFYTTPLRALLSAGGRGVPCVAGTINQEEPEVDSRALVRDCKAVPHLASMKGLGTTRSVSARPKGTGAGESEDYLSECNRERAPLLRDCRDSRVAIRSYAHATQCMHMSSELALPSSLSLALMCVQRGLGQAGVGRRHWAFLRRARSRGPRKAERGAGVCWTRDALSCRGARRRRRLGAYYVHVNGGRSAHQTHTTKSA